MLLKIKQHTYSSSSDYKLSTGKQLQSLGTRTSYKFCREIGKQGIHSKKSLTTKNSLQERRPEVKTCFKHKGQPPLNRQNSEWTVSWIVTDE